MQANTSTAYFTSNKFDLTEMTALLTLWFHFMFKGLMTTLYSIADWLEEQRTIQMGYLHEPNRTYPSPEPEPVTPTAEVTVNPEPEPIVTATVNPEPGCEVTMISPEPVTKISELTYKDLQRLLKDYRDQWGDVQCKLNAKRETLEREVQRLGLIA